MSTGMIRSPPRGGGDATAANQQFVVSSSDEEAPTQVHELTSRQTEAKTLSKRERKRQKLEEARALLREHGIAVPTADNDRDNGEQETHKRKKSKKKKHKSKH